MLLFTLLRRGSFKNNIIVLLLAMASLGLAIRFFRSTIQPKIEHLSSEFNKPDTTITTDDRINVTVETPEIIHEPFWDFLYKFIPNPEFMKSRMSSKYSEVQIQAFRKVLTYGKFVYQDSLQTYWIYTSEYKGRTFPYTFVNKNGKWYYNGLLK